MKKSLQELSIDSQVLYQRIIKLAYGESVSYAELSKLIGRDIQRFRHFLLYRAMSIALRVDRMVYVTIRNEGIKRLDNDDIPVVIGVNSIDTIHRASRKGAKKIVAANYDTLPDTIKIKHNANLSILSAFVQMTRPAAIKKIEIAVASNELNKITYAKTLEQFKQA